MEIETDKDQIKIYQELQHKLKITSKMTEKEAF